MPDREMTDAELSQPATKRDLLDLRRELRADFDEQLTSTSESLRTDFTEKLTSTRDELRLHFDIVAERFHSDFANLFDWTQSTTSTIGTRVDDLETRVTRLEQRRKD